MTLRVAWLVFAVNNEQLEYDEKIRQRMSIKKTYLCKTLKFRTTASGQKIVEFDLEESLCIEADPDITLKEAREKGFRVVIDVLE